MRKIWFKRKLYGWGWAPSSWQGWLVTVFFVGIVLSIAFSFTDETTIVEAVGSLIVPILLLIAVCYMTGESPRWQWGKRIEDVEHTPFE